MKVRYTKTALAEIDEICSCIARDNPKAAAAIAAAIEKTVNRIAERPRSAPIAYEGQVRAKLVERYQYRIFYAVVGVELIIRNIRSTRRRQPWERQET
jgi:toxin ParE1/3/4